MFLRLDRRSTLARRRRDQGEVVEDISNVQYPISNIQYPKGVIDVVGVCP
jgi:hypothetical protein